MVVNIPAKNYYATNFIIPNSEESSWQKRNKKWKRIRY